MFHGSVAIRVRTYLLLRKGVSYFSTTQFEHLNQSRNVSFSGSGFLCVFHLGVAQGLIQKKVITDESRFAGASGGALVAASLGSHVSIDVALDALLSVAAKCRKNGTVGHVGKPLMEALEKLVPCNGAELCNGKVKIAVTCIWPKVQSPILVDQYVDRNDLLLALKSSCFIPFYLDPAMSVKWREGYFVDGGFAQLVPAIPSYLYVVVFPHKHLGPILHPLVRKSKDIISPSLLQDFPYTLQDLVKRSLIPSSEKDLLDLFQWGQKAAIAWADAQEQP